MENYIFQRDNLSSEMETMAQKILDSITPCKKYEKGQIIYHQGDLGDNFYYLKKGKVSVFMTSSDGIEKTLNTASSGEILGEAAFFDKLPRVSSAKAIEDSEIVIIDKNRLIELIRKYPNLAMELLETQAKRIRLLSSQIDSMAFLQADARIAQLLLQYKTVQKSKIYVHLTHEEIGSMAGVTRVTVSKILNTFVKKGIVKTQYRQIEILNQALLEELLAE